MERALGSSVTTLRELQGQAVIQMDSTTDGAMRRTSHPGRGARGGAAVAALTGLLYEVASVAYRLIVEGRSAAPDIGRFIGLGLAWVAASWLVALPATAIVGARLAEASRRTLVAGYTLAAGASLTLFAVLVILVLNLPMPGPGAVAVTIVAAFGAAFVSAVLLTRPRGRGPSDSRHPGGKTDPAIPERTRAAADT